ncbi:MAG: hypothetical protein KDA96_20935 [Planctomycetaceae bacterium]|nr:hypothetical protein [Planctomycetaceae bacterium]
MKSLGGLDGSYWSKSNIRTRLVCAIAAAEGGAEEFDGIGKVSIANDAAVAGYWADGGYVREVKRQCRGGFP